MSLRGCPFAESRESSRWCLPIETTSPVALSCSAHGRRSGVCNAGRRDQGAGSTEQLHAAHAASHEDTETDLDRFNALQVLHKAKQHFCMECKQRLQASTISLASHWRRCHWGRGLHVSCETLPSFKWAAQNPLAARRLWRVAWSVLVGAPLQ
jgi:hypothetical protein